jgi:hypothetical protein
VVKWLRCVPATKPVSPQLTQGSRHCEEQSDEAIQVLFLDCFALRFAGLAMTGPFDRNVL